MVRRQYPDKRPQGWETYKLEQMATQFPMSLCMCSLEDGRLVRNWVGASITAITGYTVEELESEPELLLEIVHPSDRGRIDTAYRHLVEGQPLFEEYRIFRKNGQMRWVRDDYAVAKDEHCAISMIIGIVRDITREKAVLQDLGIFKPLIDDAPAAVAIRDMSGRMVYCNEACARLYGYDSALDMLGTDIFDAIPQEHRQEFEQEIRPKVLAGRWSGEISLIRRDGTTIFAGISTNVLRDQEGKPTGVYAILSDLTERRKIEEQLGLAQFSVDSAAQMVTWLDKNGRFLYVNDVAVQSLGYSREELLNMTVSDIDPIFTPDKWNACWDELYQMGSQTLESIHRRKDGTLYPIEVTAKYLEYRGKEYVFAFVRDITKRKRIQSELELDRFVVEHAAEMICWVDKAGRFLYVNEVAARTLGYTPEELRSLTVSDIDVSFTPAGWKQHWREGQDSIFHKHETQFKKKDGSLIDVELAVNHIVFCDKEYHCVFGRDISERKKIERALRESEEKYRNLVEKMHDWVWEVDENCVYTYASPRVRDLLGYEPEDIVGRVCFDLMSADEAQRLAGEFIPLTATRAPFKLLENKMLRKDGKPVTVEVSAAPIIDEHGKFRGYRGIDRDITERKRAEDALRLTQEKYRNLVERINDWVWEIDENNVYTFASLRVRDLLGYEPEEVMGRTPFDFMPPGERERVSESFRRVKARHEPFSLLENTLLRKDGRRVVVETSGMPVFDEQGYYRGYRGIDRDITEAYELRRIASEALDLYRAVVQDAPSGIFIVQNHRIVLANRSIANTMGYEPHEVIGREIWEFVHPDDIGWLRDYNRRRLKGEDVPTHYVARGIARSGEVRYFDYRATRIQYANAPAVLLNAIDTTDRVRDHQALEESERKYRTLIENVEAVIFRLDPELRPITLIGNVEKISGYTNEELLEKPLLWAEQIHPDDLEEAKRAYREMVKTRTSRVVETRLVKRGGEVRWVRTHVTPHLDEKGNLLYFDGVGVDITERVDAQQREARRTKRMEVLGEIIKSFEKYLDSEEILRSMSRSMADVIECLAVAVAINPKTGRICNWSADSRDPEIAAKANEVFEHADITFTGADGIRTTISSGLKNLPPQMVDFGEKMGIGPVMGVPVIISDDRVYLLMIGRLKGKPEFSEEEVWLMTEVASHASTALNRATLYKRQAQIAETLQRSLIPEKPTVKGLELATRYIPAAGESQVGGDFYDVIYLPDDMVGIVVGDVSGKGIDAAIHTAQAKYMLRGFVLQNPDPGFVVTELNTGLYAFTGEFTFVTLVYILLEPRAHKLTYTNAGHEAPIILCRDTRIVRELNPNGPILGVVHGQFYSSGSMSFEPDHMLFCYTDGVTDVPGDGDRFGHERLLDTIANAPANTAQELLDYVVTAINEYGAGKQPDDQVIVVIRPQY